MYVCQLSLSRSIVVRIIVLPSIPFTTKSVVSVAVPMHPMGMSAIAASNASRFSADMHTTKRLFDSENSRMSSAAMDASRGMSL